MKTRSDKNIPARWMQAAAITFVLYLMMVMEPSMRSGMTGWQSSFASAKMAGLVGEIPLFLR